MKIELNINGYFDMTIFYLNGKVVGDHKDQDILQGILDNLQQGEYLISLNDKTIKDINNLSETLYTFELDATDALEYEFSENQN